MIKLFKLLTIENSLWDGTYLFKICDDDESVRNLASKSADKRESIGFKTYFWSQLYFILTSPAVWHINPAPHKVASIKPKAPHRPCG